MRPIPASNADGAPVYGRVPLVVVVGVVVAYTVTGPPTVWPPHDTASS